MTDGYAPQPSFQISGKGFGFARTRLSAAAHGYASSEMPDQGKGWQSGLLFFM